MPGNPRSGSKACASSPKISRASGKKAVTTCAAIRGDRAMVNGSAGRNWSADIPVRQRERSSRSTEMKEPIRPDALNAGKMPALQIAKDAAAIILLRPDTDRSEEHTSELQ